MPSQPRTVTIPVVRLRPWMDNFGIRHGEPDASMAGHDVRLTSPDGAEARIATPFPPAVPLQRTAAESLVDLLIAHAERERRLGAVLVRKGGYAVGIFAGDRLTASKVGSSYVQGKTKAGGWSQQRYARRRDNQSRKAYESAADEAVRLLVPQLGTLEAVVTGGDATAVAAVLADQRLTDLRPLVLPNVYPVADPRLRVLQAFPEQFRAISIQLNDLA